MGRQTRVGTKKSFKVTSHLLKNVFVSVYYGLIALCLALAFSIPESSLILDLVYQGF